MSGASKRPSPFRRRDKRSEPLTAEEQREARDRLREAQMRGWTGPPPSAVAPPFDPADLADEDREVDDDDEKHLR